MPESEYADTSGSPILTALQPKNEEYSHEFGKKLKANQITEENKNGLILVIDHELDIRKLLNDFLSKNILLPKLAMQSSQ